MLSNRWVRNFTVREEDVETLMNVLLERETPMTTPELGLYLVKQRLEKEQAALQERFKDTKVYNPSHDYALGDRLVFTEMDYALATVEAIRPGNNPDYGDFSVITVRFDDEQYHNSGQPRYFAANLKTDHRLSAMEADTPLGNQSNGNPEDLLRAENGHILRAVHEALREEESLRRVAGYWFPSELVLDFDIGALHLTEAVLDMAGGGPLSTEEIIKQIGGLSDAPMQLQVFSLNLAINSDDRFDEVGPAGDVLWYLKRMEPEYVQKVPALLEYRPIEYDDDLLSDEMFDLETELDDEHTPIDFEGELQKATTTLIYPHRRAGTLPLNAKNQALFPYARIPRIHIEFVDAMDGETFSGWVVHDFKYVYGLLDYYAKHRLPVGAYVTVERGEHPGQFIISYEAYKPRTEWIRILTPHNNQVAFENKKRAIGAEYDDLIIIGVDDLAAVDKLAETYRKKPLATILRELISALGKLSLQGAVPAVTLYSAVNVLRRCAPGPIFATLTANPDFQDVGDHYWTLSE